MLLTCPARTRESEFAQTRAHEHAQRAFTETPPPSPPAALAVTAPEEKVAAPATNATAPPSRIARLLSSMQLSSSSDGGAEVPASLVSSSCGGRIQSERRLQKPVRACTHICAAAQGRGDVAANDGHANRGVAASADNKATCSRLSQSHSSRGMPRKRDRTATSGAVSADVDGSGLKNAAGVDEGTAACKVRATVRRMHAKTCAF